MFLDILFPTSISVDAVGSGSGFNTLVHTSASGFEQRNINWSLSRGTWNVAHVVKTQSQYDEIQAFHRVSFGKAHTWRFKDFADYRATDSSLGTGDGSETAFQLRKVYSVASFTYARTITKPEFGTVQVYDNGSLQTPGTHYALDYTTGIVTFVTPPADGHVITATFRFHCHCRFDIDQLSARIVYPPGDDQSRLLVTCESIPIVEIKES